MAVSRDSRRWWFPDRVACLDNPPMGDYGGGMIWQSQNLIVQDDKLYVYFGGTEGAHRQLIDTRAPSVEIAPMERIVHHEARLYIPFNSALCRAHWQLDRMYALVSSAGGPTVGAAITQPKPLGGSDLWVNVKTRPVKNSKNRYYSGVLQVELLNDEAEPIDGFTRDDCVPLQGDHRAVQVAWKGGTVAPDSARQAKFYLKRALLYGFEFRGLK